MTELKPCPFYGGEARLWHPKEYGITLGSVKCNSCGGSTELLTDDDSAIEAWNTRPNPWHTGTPTEEGWYLICSPSWDMFPSKYNVAEFDGKDFVYAEGMHQIVVRTNPTTVAWQKITPFKGEEVNG